MKIQLLDYEKLIKEKGLKEISDPILFNKGMTINPNGLLSYEIFGSTVKERKETYAYIDLKEHFLTPLAYKNLISLDRRFKDVINGTALYRIEHGKLIEDENGDTGITWLYDNWENIRFEHNASRQRTDRINYLTKNPKRLVFTRYWLVIPPFSRDVKTNDRSTKTKVHEINELYAKLIRNASLLKNTDFDFKLNGAKNAIQSTLVEIYDSTELIVSKKRGKIRQSLMGKSVDYAARMVISNPAVRVNSYKDMRVDFFHTGVPLAQCCSTFHPFIMHWLTQYFSQEFSDIKTYPVIDNDEIKYVVLDNPSSYFNPQFLKKRIDEFIFSPESRFDKIIVPTKNIKNEVYLTFTGYLTSGKNIKNDSNRLVRPLTWTDILFKAAQITNDKAIYVTRFPVTDYFSSYPSKVRVMSTQMTTEMTIGNDVYKWYPIVDLSTPKNKIAQLFIDTVNLANPYLGGLGGDYDGDQVTIKGVFSQEANNEADRIMRSKMNFINPKGDLVRQSTNESVQALYNLTKM